MFHCEHGPLVAVLVQILKVVKNLLVRIGQALPAQLLLLLLEPHEKLLCMAPDLRASPRTDVFFNHTPIFAVESKTF